MSTPMEIIIEGTVEEGLMLIYNGKPHPLPAGTFPGLIGKGRMVIAAGSFNAHGFSNIASSQVNGDTFVNGVNLLDLVERTTGETVARPQQGQSNAFTAASISSTASAKTGEESARKIAEKIRLKNIFKRKRRFQ